jgi:glyoxylase-like metal-dependent hydrolase (beta-lactamase superfamily II)
MLSNSETRASTPDLMAVAPGLHGLRDVFVNLYYAAATTPGLGAGLPTQGAPWVLIDAGLPGSAGKIKQHAEELFGTNNPPQAILLTHGHFDHVGALQGMLDLYPGVFAYAHPLELPYLTGQSAYPPPDPTVGGGLMAYLSFSYPKHAYDFGGRVQALPADGTVPSLPGWRWVATPGHTFGHVSFFREAGKVLVAGDAFTTVKGESGWATYTQKQIVHGPPAYFTPDWDAARESVRQLAALQPEVAATGHGIAMHGEELRQQLADLASDFDTVVRPKLGRYATTPATADASGVRSIPPPLVSPVVKSLAVAGTLGAVIALIAGGSKKKKAKRKGGRDYVGTSRPQPNPQPKSGPSAPRGSSRPLAPSVAGQHDDGQEDRDLFSQEGYFDQGYYGQDELRDLDQSGYEVRRGRHYQADDFPRRSSAADALRNTGRPGRPVLMGPIGGGNGEPLVFAHHFIRFD